MSKKLYEKMNLYLANQEVAYIKLHNLHWYVKGRSFFTLHAKLEELYDRTAEIIDAVAERLLAVGQAPVANMKEALALATIKELADKPISSEETVQGLIADVEYWIRDTKEIVELADITCITAVGRHAPMPPKVRVAARSTGCRARPAEGSRPLPTD